MSTIRNVPVGEAEGLTKDVYEDIMRTYGIREPYGLYMLMGHTPEFLAASWLRSHYLYGNDSKYSLKDKHILTLGMSAVNNCEYCVRIHTDRLWQLGMTKEELIELMMVVDVVNGYDTFAEGTRAGDDPTTPYLTDDDADAAAKEVYEDIKKAYGNREPEVIYRLMGYHPEYLKWSWERSKLCFEEEGKLGLKLKHIIAFCVAATNSNDHFVKAYTKRLKELDLTDEDLVELLLVIDLTCGYNRYVQGLQAQIEKKPFGAGAEANKAASVKM